MIDLHSHILPGIDDGAKSLEISLEMARLAVADGIHTMACTPHIYPGMYMNDAQGIALARDALQAELDAQGIALRLVTGADVHLVPDLLAGLRAGRWLRVPPIKSGSYRIQARVDRKIADGVWLNSPSPHRPPSSQRRSPQLSPRCS